ncbi:MAG: low molecular weight phosphotyrosine protein phosphatase, partial [Planctomycetota bacterium]
MADYRILFVCTGNTCRSPMADATSTPGRGPSTARANASA